MSASHSQPGNHEPIIISIMREHSGETGPMDEEILGRGKSSEETDLNKKWIRCDTPNCGNPAVGLLALRFYCIGHFISHCYEKLERCNPNPMHEPDVVDSVAVDRFLQQCVAQASELVRPIRGFDNLDRARLFDIFLWASDLVAKRCVFKASEAQHVETKLNAAELARKTGAG
jgi:hypothetical protein